MWRGLFVVVVLLAISAALFVVLTSSGLPDEVALHFNLRGEPDNWASRQFYISLIVGFILIYPALVVLAFSWLPRTWPHRLKIRNRDYWVAPERREGTLQYLATHGCWLSIMLLLLLASLHYMIVAAHNSQPPKLPLPQFFAVLGCFGIGVSLWGVKMFRRFALPGDQRDKNVAVSTSR